MTGPLAARSTSPISPSAPDAIAGISSRAGDDDDISAWNGPGHDRDGRSNRDDTPLARSFRTR